MTDERLARALDVFLRCQEAGAEPSRALAENPDVADLLQLLFDGERAAPAEVTFGDYRVEGELGRGGAGVVYRAVQRSLGRRVALKVLAAGAATDPTRVARFRREALALGSLEHAHVVRVFDVGETDGRHWLAMELVEGGSLADRIAALREGGGHRGGSLREVVECAAAVAAALDHVHRAGMLHRDVKPSNTTAAPRCRTSASRAPSRRRP
jgi:serine/threonine protein kinase